MPDYKEKYNGLTVSAITAAELRNSQQSEYLNISDNKDGTFNVQVKMPEKGRDIHGNEYNVRENINYFMRGLAKSCLDENGRFDFDKADDIDTELEKNLILKKLSPEFIAMCDIPADKLDDFKKFLNIHYMNLLELRSGFSLEIDQMRTFQYNLNNYGKSTGNAVYDTERDKLVKESYNDYINTVNKFTKMAGMNPVEEKNTYFSTDGQQFNSVFGAFNGANNMYREAHGQPEVTIGEHKVEISIKVPDDPENNLYGISDAHNCVTMNVTMVNKPKVLAFEMTKAPTGKLFFAPEGAQTGISVYDSTDEIAEYYLNPENSLVHVENADVYDKCRTLSSKLTADTKKAENSPRVERELLIPFVNEAFNKMKAEADKKSPAQLDAEFLKYQSTTNAARDAAEKILNDAVNAAQADKNTNFDDIRLSTKTMLAVYASSYENTAKGDPKLESIVSKMKEYAALNANSVNGNYERESALYKEITKEAEDYFTELDNLQLGTDDYDPEAPENRARYAAVADIFNYFEGQRDGNLAAVEENAIKIDGTKYSIYDADGNGPEKFYDKKDMPLFPHDPSPNDINQGGLGDCYLLSALAAVAEHNPQKIRDCMRDNGDGTVTVRFYQQNTDEITGENKGYTPVYVTVDKMVPESTGAEDCLWAQVIERAYVASGLHLTSEKFAKPAPSAAELKKEYDRLSKLKPEELPAHEDCPWLIDEKGDLHEWRPNYDDISAGSQRKFLEQFYGEEVKNERVSLELFKKSPQGATPDEGTGYIMGYAMLDVLGDKATQFDKDLIFNEKCAGVKFVQTYCIFRMLYPDKEITLENHSKITTEAKEELQSCELIASLFHNTFPFDIDFNELDRNETKEELTKTCETFKKLLDDPKSPEVPQMLREGYDQHKEYFTPEFLDKVKTVFLPNMTKHIDVAANIVAPPKPYSGEYATTESMIYEDLKDIGGSKVGTCGTYGESDTRMNNGIYQRHGYSILGVTEENLNGKDLKFVILRNPHGRTGRVYYEENNEVKCRSERDVPGGVFKMELHDFCREFSVYDITDINYKEPEPEKAEVKEPEKENAKESAKEPEKENAAKQPAVKDEEKTRLTGDIFTQYSRALASIYKTLDTTGNDSAEFTKFYNSLGDLVKKDFSDLRGKPLDEVLRSAEFEKVTDACDKYQKYCDEHSKGRERRANRLQQVRNIRMIADSLRHEAKSPKDYCAGKLVDKLMANNEPYKSLSPENKIKQIRTFCESRQFKFLKTEMNFNEMSKLSEQKTVAIYQKWNEVGAKLMKEELGERKAEPAPVRTEEKQTEKKIEQPEKKIEQGGVMPK